MHFFSVAACDEIFVFSAKILPRSTEMHAYRTRDTVNELVPKNGFQWSRVASVTVQMRCSCKSKWAHISNGSAAAISKFSLCPYVAEEKRTTRNAPKNRGPHQEFSGQLCMCSRHENRVNCLCDFSPLWFKKGKRLSCTLSCCLERALFRISHDTISASKRKTDFILFNREEWWSFIIEIQLIAKELNLNFRGAVASAKVLNEEPASWFCDCTCTLQTRKRKQNPLIHTKWQTPPEYRID